jgi:uncharacterized protein YjiS (DUF1127 family)
MMAYHTYDTSIDPVRSLQERTGSWIAETVRGIGDFYAERGRLAQLAALDRRTLHDIGLHPTELQSVAHNPHDTTRRR